MNFMLPVPEASLLAVEICSETSAAAKDHLCIGYTVVFDKYNFHLSVDGSVIIYNICYGVDQFDDLFARYILLKPLLQR